MTGIELIAAERERQVSQEGWTPEHDDKHIGGELAVAAGCYAMCDILPSGIRDLASGRQREVPFYWPWEAEWWKPSSDEIRNLAKAGAMLAAELDRRLRAKSALQEQPND